MAYALSLFCWRQLIIIISKYRYFANKRLNVKERHASREKLNSKAIANITICGFYF